MIVVLAGLLQLSFAACGKQDTEQGLGNDCINRSRIAPYIVGDTIKLVYAMYMPYGTGNLVTASVNASIPGAENTMLEHRAYTVNDTGQDLPSIVVGNPCYTEGGLTTVDFIIDTCAVSLRYYYVIPEEARDRNVSFECSVSDNRGRRATFNEGPCKVRKMDMFNDIQMSLDYCYFSVEQMKAYTGEGAAAAEIPIDFVWTYITKPSGVDAGSTFISPTSLDKMIPHMSVTPTPPPDELMRPTDKMWMQMIIDTQLVPDDYDGVFIDDIDFATLDLKGGVEYLIGITTRRGFWIETTDAKYRAYIYVRQLSSGGCALNAKRYQMY